MEFTISQCRAILDTLPIGYYCKYRIALEMSDSEPTSYFSPMEEKIVISYPIIKEGVDRLPADTTDFEQAVRSMLYHETSHAILTPNNLFYYAYGYHDRKEILNIFEDERIETLLKDFYMDVDFKKQINNICGGPKAHPSTTMEKFFNIVRFRTGPEKYIKEVEYIINKYKAINRSYTRYDSAAIHDYAYEVFNLFNRIDSDTTSSFDMPEESASMSGDKMPKKIDKISESSENEGQPMESQTAIGLSDDEIKKMLKEAIEQGFSLDNTEKDNVNKFLNMLEVLFANFNKKNHHGNGINAYSGIFNPRAVARNDYKYFERSIAVNGNNKFGSLHLNLFLDKSGSFYDNQNIVNAILRSLCAFERKNKNFSMDVYFINENFTHAKTIRERQMICGGGNEVPADISTIFAKAQKPNTFNYNIVLFDGDAFSDTDAKNNTEIKRRFKGFDKKQTFLITDPYNSRYIDNFTAAKVIVTRNYTTELITNLTRAFQTMLS